MFVNNSMYDFRYDPIADQANPTGDKGPKSWSRSDVESWLVDQVRQVNNGNDLDSKESLFQQGFDRLVYQLSYQLQSRLTSLFYSLSATFLRSRILGGLKSLPKGAAEKLPQNIVYIKPTIIELVDYLTVFAHADAPGDTQDKRKEIEETIHRFTEGLSAERLDGPLILPAVVLLTGSTGSLGSFLLESLLRDDRVERVYALNRHYNGRSGLERQMSSFEDRGLSIDLLKSEKVRFIEGHLASDKLNLSSEMYEEVCSFVAS
jgi:hypothetical protein